MEPLRNTEERILNRVEIVEKLQELGPTRLLDFMELDDEEVLSKIYELAKEWSMNKDDVTEVCGLEYYVQYLKDKEQTER